MGNRREFLRLAALGALWPGALAWAQKKPEGILVNDLQRSAAFYQGLFGLTPHSEDKPNQILRLGTKRERTMGRRHSNTPL